MKLSRRALWGRIALIAGALVALTVVVLVVQRLRAKPDPASALVAEVVSVHDIAQTVEATGTVQAIDVVEIKSKASGAILQMPVEIGSEVAAGDLLVQIDPLTVRNQYTQVLAAVRAAAAAVQVTAAQQKRADDLYAQEAMTAVDHDAATLGAASARAARAKTASDLQIAKQALADATVRAPSAGTIIEQNVTRGMVITSATSSASGGTTLLKMADLQRIEINALVGETDVGMLRPGMSAKITIDAFPTRTFAGEVIKIEPQALVQQSVTMFPVLVSIANENGRLLPGMNGEVTIEIASRSQVVAVPLDAVRAVREAPAIALSLGLDPDTLAAQLQRQSAARAQSRAAARPDSAPADAAAPRGAGRGGRGRGGAGGGRTGGGGGAAGRSRAQFVVVQTANGLEARLVRVGISDFDFVEVLEGVRPGERVVMLSVVEQSAKRKQQQAQLAQRMGNSMTGGTGAAGGGGGGRGGGGGGGGGGH